jgi:acyl carrier protein
LDIETKIARYVADKLRMGSSDVIAPDQSLFEAGVLDSVGIFDLVTFLEEEFGLSVGDEEIVPENFESVKAITAFVTRLREAS